MAVKTQPYAVQNLDSVLGSLHSLKTEFENKHLTQLFAEDPQRFEKYSVPLEPVVLILVNIESISPLSKI